MALVSVPEFGGGATSVPAVATRNILAAGIEAMSGAHDLIVFDGNDSEVWSVKTPGDNLQSAIMVNNTGVVYASHISWVDDNSDGIIDAVERRYGLVAYNELGVEAWDVPFEGSIVDVWSVPAGVLLALGTTGEVKRVDTTGAEVWSYAGLITPAVSIMQNSDGDVFACSRSVVHKLTFGGGFVWALEADPNYPFTCLSARAGGGCFVSQGRDVLFLDNDGLMDGPTFHGFGGDIKQMRPMPGGGFVGCARDGTVRRVSNNGLQIWRYNVPNGAEVQSVDVALDGSVVAGGVDGFVYRIGADGVGYGAPYNANLNTLFSVSII